MQGKEEKELRDGSKEGKERELSVGWEVRDNHHASGEAWINMGIIDGIGPGNGPRGQGSGLQGF